MANAYNDALDERVLAAVKAGSSRASTIQDVTGGNMREVDRSLQRLRKKDKIRFMSPGGWKVVEQKKGAR